MSTKGKTWRKGQGKTEPSTAERVRRLFTSLCAQIDGGHFGNGIKTCDKILRLSAGDADARKTKLFLLLQMGEYDAALGMMVCGEERERGFERAYALYRLQREEEAAAVLDEARRADDDERGVMHLRAQMAYRTGSFSQAVDLYTQLLDSAQPTTDEHQDIQTNLHASQRSLEFTTTGFVRALGALPAQDAASLSSVLALSSLSRSDAPRRTDTERPAPPAQKPPRRSRVPRGVVPGVSPPPDPERWIKKSERAGGAGVGRRRRGGAAGAGAGAGATQGSVSVGAEGVGSSTTATAKARKRK